MTTQMVRGVPMGIREVDHWGADGVVGPGREGASGVLRAQRCVLVWPFWGGPARVNQGSDSAF